LAWENKTHTHTHTPDGCSRSFIVGIFIKFVDKFRLNLDINNKHFTSTQYTKLILPLVFHGCETWSLTIREEHRLRAFENRVLRRIFGPRRDEVTGEWRKLHND
jgi:hypothetical protein